MATLKIREYSRIGSAGSLGNGAGNFDIADESSGIVDQAPVSFTATHGVSAAFAATTRYVGIKADAKFAFSVGVAPQATANMIDLPADTIYFFAVTPGAGHKVSAITA